jgi:Tetracyclin repressor-like, C-terminal domain
VREYLGRRVFGLITQALGLPDGELRTNLLGSPLIGLAMIRYISCIEPIASAPVEQLVTAIGPTVQRYLTGEIGAAGGSVDRTPADPKLTDLPASLTS